MHISLKVHREFPHTQASTHGSFRDIFRWVAHLQKNTVEMKKITLCNITHNFQQKKFTMIKWLICILKTLWSDDCKDRSDAN